MLKTALEYETNIEKLYREGSQRIKDAAGSKIFSMLANEEMNHIKYLSDLLSHYEEHGEIRIDQIKEEQPKKKDIIQEVSKIKSEIVDIKDDYSLSLLRKALEMEKKTTEFYKEMTSTTDDDKLKAIFKEFLEIEESHTLLVQAQIDAIIQNGYWFDFLEVSFDH